MGSPGGGSGGRDGRWSERLGAGLVAGSGRPGAGSHGDVQAEEQALEALTGHARRKGVG